ncbi:NAD(P)-dependent dehydrogenase (short-subunit alcohol dehydrogenase family) [Actinocorallia herbida]|uniref:NAD(P)-dependent dehydrogenase (Short-subunit alcohol dehydrogenase family) n=1 Tax=Actinocorallia herbida TaxID=58109 RepID=A0A3N1CXY1_9ACTN|nr:SDR family oxidoreductase [Actinocorallia herbida]ROO86157.1 NAD(P)-dependent dehydrogenase (short-subunit alcohol dehydrogenase family) [Actinocorallia herbida]
MDIKQAFDFTGTKVVLLGTGIGINGPEDLVTASAVAFAQCGAEVAIAQATKESAEAAEAAVRAAGGDPIVFTHDPRDPHDVERIAAELPWESVNTLVTHHFANDFGRFPDVSIEQFDETVRINLTGVYAASRAFLPHLRRAENASMVHAGSIDGTFGNPNVVSYSASKGGVHVLVHMLAAQLAGEGIRVNGVSRAGSSAMPLNPSVVAELGRATPLRPVAEPEEYASAVLYLASPAASYVSGVLLPVDGGRTAPTPGCSPGYTGYPH